MNQLHQEGNCTPSLVFSNRHRWVTFHNSWLSTTPACGKNGVWGWGTTPRRCRAEKRGSQAQLWKPWARISPPLTSQPVPTLTLRLHICEMEVSLIPTPRCPWRREDMRAWEHTSARPSPGAQWWRIHLLVQERPETWVHPPGREGPREKETATHPFSCLGNSVDRGAWWATVHAVAKSWTRQHARVHGRVPQGSMSFRAMETLRGLENTNSQATLRDLTREADEGLGRLYLRCTWAVQLEGTSLTCPGRPEPALPDQGPVPSRVGSLPTTRCPGSWSPVCSQTSRLCLGLSRSASTPPSTARTAQHLGPAAPKPRASGSASGTRGGRVSTGHSRPRKASLPPGEVGSVAGPDLQGPPAVQRTGSASRKEPQGRGIMAPGTRASGSFLHTYSSV